MWPTRRRHISWAACTPTTQKQTTPRPEEEATPPTRHPNTGRRRGAGETQVEAKIGIPDAVVRFIIGRGGESIASRACKGGQGVACRSKRSTRCPPVRHSELSPSLHRPRQLIENMVKKRMVSNQASNLSSGCGVGCCRFGNAIGTGEQCRHLNDAASKGAHIGLCACYRPGARCRCLFNHCQWGVQLRNICADSTGGRCQ